VGEGIGGFVRGIRSAVLPDVTPTIGAAAYVTGDQVGGLMTFTGAARLAGAGGRLSLLRILDRSAQTAALELHVWSVTSPTVTSTDSQQVNVADANFDMDSYVGWVPILTTDWAAFPGSANSVASVVFQSADYVCGTSSTSIFGLLVARSSVTYTNGDLTVGLTSLLD